MRPRTRQLEWPREEAWLGALPCLLSVHQSLAARVVTEGGFRWTLVAAAAGEAAEAVVLWRGGARSNFQNTGGGWSRGSSGELGMLKYFYLLNFYNCQHLFWNLGRLSLYSIRLIVTVPIIYLFIIHSATNYFSTNYTWSFGNSCSIIK